MPRVDPDFYEGISRELLGKFGRVAHFTSHRPSIGAYHEEVLRETLEAVVSPRFAVRTGFSFNGRDHTSKQGDILIVDENDPAPYFFRQGRFVVVHPRALVCVVEVKTTMHKAGFLDAVENLATFVDVAASTTPKRIPSGFVFAHSGARFRPDTLDAWYKQVTLRDEIEMYPLLLFSMTHGILQLRPGTGDNWGHYHINATDKKALQARCLSMFLAAIRKVVEVRAGVEGNPFEFAALDGLAWSKQYMRYGAGIVDPGGAGPGETT